MARSQTLRRVGLGMGVVGNNASVWASASCQASSAGYGVAPPVTSGGYASGAPVNSSGGAPAVSRTMQYADPYAAVRASIGAPVSEEANTPPSYESYQGYR